MKKILAVILALTMALSLGTVAFAASYTQDISLTPSDINVFKNKEMVAVNGAYPPGETFYIMLENKDSEYNSGKAQIKSTSALKNYRLNYRINDGKKFISSIKFVTKTDGNQTQAWIAISTTSAYTNQTMDLDVDFSIYGKNYAKVNGDDSYDFNFSASLENKVTEAGSYTTVNSDAPIVNFDDIDDNDTIELYFDNDVEFHVVARGQKELYLKYNDDPSDTVYDLDSKYSNANMEYHLFEGTNKTFRRTGKLYLPADSISNGRAPYLYQISTSGALTQVNAKYDSTYERFVIDTATLNNYVISDVALKSTGSTGGTETPTETPENNNNNNSTTTSTSATQIAAEVSQRIKDAKASGKSGSVDLTAQNEESISAADMRTIVTAAKNAGGTVRFISDTVSGGNTLGRLYVTPANATVIKNDIKYGVYTDDESVSSTKNMFEKYYNNNVAVVRLAQNDTYGFPVSIAAKVDLGSLNTKSLKFYSYNRSTGKYFVIASPAYWIDTSGYLHFNTTLAGDIVITDKALVSR